MGGAVGRLRERVRGTETAPAPRDRPVHPVDYALSLRGLAFGNTAELLVGGAEAFPRMLRAIAEAREEVLLESYIVEDDETGREFLDAAAQAARRGCRVRVVVDGVGAMGLPEARLEAIERAGGHALVYRPIAPWRPRWGLWLRNHRKLLVVDGALGFLGGLNLADNYDERRNVRRWHDLHLAIAGPAAHTLGRIFARTWNQESSIARRMPAAEEGPLVDGAAFGPAAGGAAVQVVGNIGRGNRAFMRKAFLYALKRARRSVYIANPYFIPDRPVARALRRIARRGVDVRVVIPRRSDILLCDLACRAALPPLLKDGVRVAEWQAGMMHAKAASVDGKWATVGSYNLDHRSFAYNLEVTANLLDEGIAARVERQLGEDFSASSEISLATLAARPFWQRALSAIAYRFRALL